jgi:hypothetical protein
MSRECESGGVQERGWLSEAAAQQQQQQKKEKNIGAAEERG